MSKAVNSQILQRNKQQLGVPNQRLFHAFIGIFKLLKEQVRLGNSASKKSALEGLGWKLHSTSPSSLRSWGSTDQQLLRTSSQNQFPQIWKVHETPVVAGQSAQGLLQGSHQIISTLGQRKNQKSTPGRRCKQSVPGGTILEGCIGLSKPSLVTILPEG